MNILTDSSIRQHISRMVHQQNGFDEISIALGDNNPVVSIGRFASHQVRARHIPGHDRRCQIIHPRWNGNSIHRYFMNLPTLPETGSRSVCDQIQQSTTEICLALQELMGRTRCVRIPSYLGYFKRSRTQRTSAAFGSSLLASKHGRKTSTSSSSMIKGR